VTPQQNPLRLPAINKLVVHMGVGESGERLVKGEEIMRAITGQNPVRTIAKKTQPAFNVRKGAPIGCKVTLRGDAARTFLETSLSILERTLDASQFDKNGNFSFGIEEHTDYPGMSYDPKIGIYGMDVNVVLERPGIRIARRHIEQKKLPNKQRVTKDDAIAFVREQLSVEVR
jgi:large subunit ribosomal protein L5